MNGPEIAAISGKNTDRGPTPEFKPQDQGQVYELSL